MPGKEIDFLTLKDFLEEKKEIILQRWLDRALEVYPQETRDFFRENRSPFSNPIGSTLRDGLDKILQEILQGSSPGGSHAVLEPLIKVRAVEALSPSQALGFIFSLKEIIGEILGDKEKENSLGREWLGINFRIDQMALQAFDLYLECREMVSRLKLKELESRSRQISPTGFKL